MTPRIIGLTGKAGSGKDYTYLQLEAAFPKRTFTNHKFSDLVKWDIEEHLDPNGWERLKGLWDKPYSPEVRALLQWWGTDLRRAADKDYWVRKMRDQIYDKIMAGTVRVISDVRYENEADFVLGQGGIIIRTWAEREVRARRLGLSPMDHTAMSTHPSEDELTLSYVTFQVCSTDKATWEDSGIVEKVDKFLAGSLYV